MDLRTYLKTFSDDDARQRFAVKCETSVGHLRNISYRMRPCGAALAVAIERESGGEVTRRDLCPDDWQKVWPELAAVG